MNFSEVETGELAFKPVLKTTVRPPKALIRISIGDEEICTTGGHQFWKSGTGWVKCRDLKPDALVHSVETSERVTDIKGGPNEATYNLVVADSHTYFVGKKGYLVQDLIPPPPTNMVVPSVIRYALNQPKTPE